jgi:hypothetical protein
MHGRVKQAEIANLDRPAERAAGDPQRLFGRQMARHSPEFRSS